MNPFASTPASPASPDVEESLKKLLALTSDAEQERALKEGQLAWAASRTSHCNAVAKVEGSGAAAGGSVAAACLSAMDKQRADTLRQMRSVLLLGLPPLDGAQKPLPGFSVAIEKEGPPDALAVAPAGWLAALTTYNAESCEIFDIAAGQVLRSVPSDKYGTYLGFSANSRLLFTASRQKRGLKVWDVHTGDLLRELNEVMGPFVASPNGRHLFFVDGQRGLAIYDLLVGQMVGTFHPVGGHVLALAIDVPGKQIAVAAQDGMLSLWDVRVAPDSVTTLSKVAETRLAGSERSSGLAFSADGAHLYLGTTLNRLERWSARDLQRQDSVPVGGAVEGRIVRIGQGDLLAMTLRSAPGANPTGLLVDFPARAGTVFGEGWLGMSQVVPIPRSDALLVAAWKELRTFNLPDKAQLKPLAELLPAPPESAVLTSQLGGTSLPLLKEALRDTRIEAIGVYEGPRPTGSERWAFGSPRVPGTVYVSVGTTDKPIALVLSSYQPVNWSIAASGNARIKHILLSGGQESGQHSRVMGVPGVEVTRIAGGYAYQLGAQGYAALDTAVRQYVGRSIERFQGAYSGERFSIGASDGRNGPAAAHKCRDVNGRIFYADAPCATFGLKQVGAVPPPDDGRRPSVAAPPKTVLRSIEMEAAGTRAVIRCGESTIICGASDVVVCGGQQIPCK